MRKSIALFLSLLLLLAVTVSPRTARAAATSSRSDGSDEAALFDAFARVNEVNSLHFDVGITMKLAMKLISQGLNLDLPIAMNAVYGTDIQTDPYLVRGDFTMNMDMGMFGSQSEHILIYGAQDGEKMTTYSSLDEGATWTPQENDSLHALLPGEAFGLFRDHAQDIRRAGTDTFQGAAVDVYTCRLEGKFMSQVMSSTGMEGMLSEITGGDEAALDPNALGDIPVTIYVDGNGYPVYYAMDMTEAMRDMLATAMQNVMGMTDLEGMEISVDVSDIRGECTLSDFDAIEPIVLPETALNAPEA